MAFKGTLGPDLSFVLVFFCRWFYLGASFWFCIWRLAGEERVMGWRTTRTCLFPASLIPRALAPVSQRAAFEVFILSFRLGPLAWDSSVLGNRETGFRNKRDVGSVLSVFSLTTVTIIISDWSLGRVGERGRGRRPLVYAATEKGGRWGERWDGGLEHRG